MVHLHFTNTIGFIRKTNNLTSLSSTALIAILLFRMTVPSAPFSLCSTTMNFTVEIIVRCLKLYFDILII